MPFDAILLASFGGPEGPDEVIPFLERVTAGKGIPRERLEEVGQHYFTLGGVSPINAQNRELVTALRDALTARGVGIPLVLGNRNSAPFLDTVLTDLHADGRPRVLAIATSAYASYSGCRQYREDIAAAVGDADLAGRIDVVKMRHYFDEDGFVLPFAESLAAALDRFAADGFGDDETVVAFTTHSIPHAMALGSGPLDEHRPLDQSVYVREHLDAIERTVALTARLRGLPTPEWTLSYQSRSGPPQVPWLEPDINDELAALATKGKRAVAVVPIGFVSDHMEVIWDLDNEAKATAAGLGMAFTRIATPGTHPAFVAALADKIVRTVRDGHSDDRGPHWCADGCCLRSAGGGGHPGGHGGSVELRSTVAGV